MLVFHIADKMAYELFREDDDNDDDVHNFADIMVRDRKCTSNA